MGQANDALPLVVDLDGTLSKTDLLYESLCVLLKHYPWCLLALPLWLFKGKAYLKRQISRRAHLDVSTLPYHTAFLAYLMAQHAKGRQLILATASHDRLARAVAAHCGIFDTVVASDDTTNLSDQCKRDRLVALFGAKGFDYAGNSLHDVVVWAAARRSIVVNASRRVYHAAMQSAEVTQVFNHHSRGIKPYIQALRLHQWLKNLLIFIPLLTAHGSRNLVLLRESVLAFVAFGLCASSAYMLNDLLDLAADRHHPHKRQRPFAAGDLTIRTGLLSIPLLLGLSGAVGLLLPPMFLAVLGLYYGTTLAYSLALKHEAPLDVMILASLYTLRMIAGSAATGIWPSAWLMAFTTFLFLSLALLKRYAELVVVSQERGEIKIRERDYQVGDRELLTAMGIASGYLSVVVFALYLTRDPSRTIFGQNNIIWLWCPLLLYWISYVWLVAHRGGMADDPVIFALKDWVSRIVIAGMGVALLLAG